MNNRTKLLGIIAIVAIIGFSMAACEDGGLLSTNHTHDPNWDTGLCISCGALMYKLGDTGPGGGTIYYSNQEGFGQAFGKNWHYLEAAPYNQTTAILWSATNIDVIAANQSGIGYGHANTQAIIAAHSITTPPDTVLNNAAMCAAAYNGGGKDDWFLPSDSEFIEMVRSKAYIKGDQTRLWTSTQYNTNGAYFRNFDSLSSRFGSAKTSSSGAPGVRAVRAF